MLAPLIVPAIVSDEGKLVMVVEGEDEIEEETTCAVVGLIGFKL